MIGVRYRDDEWQGRCCVCREWLPLEAEFWRRHPNVGWRRCRACVNEQQAEGAARRRAGPAIRPAENEKPVVIRRAKGQANPDACRETRHRRYLANREAICARQRARYAALSPEARAEHMARSREWMRADRARAAS